MKALICEMCGSSNLIKKDGLFVCQNCDVKYSVEEARKMMIEGPVTVQLDSSSEVENLYLLARRAKEVKSDEAKKYYEMILLKKPDDWESAFYAKLAKTYSLKNGEVEGVLYDIIASLEGVLTLVKRLPDDDREKAISSMLTDIGLTSIAFFNASLGEMSETKNPEVFSMFFRNGVAVVALTEGFANLLESVFKGDEAVYTVCVDFWERAIRYREELAPYLDDKKVNQAFIEQMADKVKKRKPDFTVPQTIKKCPGFIARLFSW